MKAGIYRITIHDTFYYGQSVDLQNRKDKHMSYLRRGQHQNQRLQRAYDKYNEFTFEVVLVCETNELDRYEQWFLDTYHSMEKCANMATYAESPGRGRTVSQEERQRQSERMQGNKRSLGYKHTQEAKDRISAARKARKMPKAERDNLALKRQEFVYRVHQADGTVREFTSSTKLGQAYGVHHGTAGRWATGSSAPHKKHGILSVERTPV